MRIGATALAYERGRGVIVQAREVELDFPGSATIHAAELSTVTTIGAVIERRIDLQAVAMSGLEIGLVLPTKGQAGVSGAALVRGVVTDLGRRWGEVDESLRRAGLDEVFIRDTLIRILDGSATSGPALEISEAEWRPLEAGTSQATATRR